MVVDTSNVLKDKSDLLTTKRVACFIQRETEVNMAQRLPKHVLLARLYNEKTYFRDDQALERSYFDTNQCLVKREKPIPPSFLTSNDMFFIGTETTSKSQ